MVMTKLARPEMLARIKERTGFEGLEVYGMYDAVIEAEANTVEELHRKINDIDKMGLIRGTETYIVARDGKKKEIRDVGTFAYILVDASPGDIDKVQTTLSEFKEVRKSDVLFGPFDIIVDVAVKNMDELNEVVRKIISMESVFKTCTLVSSKIH